MLTWQSLALAATVFASSQDMELVVTSGSTVERGLRDVGDQKCMAASSFIAMLLGMCL